MIRRVCLLVSVVWVLFMGALLVRTGNYMWGPLAIVFAPVILGLGGLLAVRYVVNGSRTGQSANVALLDGGELCTAISRSQRSVARAEITIGATASSE